MYIDIYAEEAAFALFLLLFERSEKQKQQNQRKKIRMDFHPSGVEPIHYKKMPGELVSNKRVGKEARQYSIQRRAATH